CLTPGSIALTFDDGYLDNLTNALPVLEKYKIPATIFITTNFIGQEIEFWWDEIEKIFLEMKQIPSSLSVSDDSGKTWDWTLRSNQDRIKAWEDIQQMLRNMKYEEIYSFLKNLSENWLGIPYKCRKTHKILNKDQLVQLSKSNFIEIGSHTLTHSKLSQLNYNEQFNEINESKKIIESIIQKKVNFISYPYGNHADFNEDSMIISQQSEYLAGISNIQGIITNNNNLYSLPRLLVRDWNIKEFSQWINDTDKKILELKTLNDRKEKFINYLGKNE
nr:polysaccharide deacetylase family protein [Candidatus Cloacimonadota bacterium]